MLWVFIRGASKEYSQHNFSWTNKEKKAILITLLPGAIYAVVILHIVQGRCSRIGHKTHYCRHVNANVSWKHEAA